MYLVIAHWKTTSENREEFLNRGTKVREVLRNESGVVFNEAFESENTLISVIGYENEDAYNRIVNAEDGSFMNAVKEQDLESFGTWLRSERGTAISK